MELQLLKQKFNEMNKHMSGDLENACDLHYYEGIKTGQRIESDDEDGLR